MKKAVLFLIIIAALEALPLDKEWNNFKLSHQKVYELEEEAFRHKIFRENLLKVEKHNEQFRAGKVTYEMGVNQFADMTEEEFQKYLTLSSHNILRTGASSTYKPPERFTLPDSVDYRKQGAVNPIKDQGYCASCWAFSATGALESLYYLKTKKLLSLSEQNLIDCSRSYGNYGCGGGIMRFAYDYIRDNGIETEEEYPYNSRNGVCHYAKNESVVSIQGFTVIKPGSEKDLTTAIADVGPITVAVDSSGWQLYKSGIFVSNKTFVHLNHGVVAIGYGEEDGNDFYIVRNSWGRSWGEDGYIRVARNLKNQIGIADDACFPIV